MLMKGVSHSMVSESSNCLAMRPFFASTLLTNGNLCSVINQSGVGVKITIDT